MSNIKGTNPKDLLGAKKAPLHLVPASSIIYQALAMEDGGNKYGPYNWRDNDVLASIYVSAAMRHLMAWYDSREELAEDSRKPHLGHALSCIGILVDALEGGNLVDDRPAEGPAARLIVDWTKKEKPEEKSPLRDLSAGQTWKTRGGVTVTLEHSDSPLYPFRDNNPEGFFGWGEKDQKREFHWNCYGGGESKHDLVEYIDG